MVQDREAFFEEDRRYPQCNKEAWATFIFFLVNFVLIGGTALILGYNKPAGEVQLVAGFPAWFLYGAGVGTILECIVAVVVVKLFFKDMSIQPGDDRGERR